MGRLIPYLYRRLALVGSLTAIKLTCKILLEKSSLSAILPLLNLRPPLESNRLSGAHICGRLPSVMVDAPPTNDLTSCCCRYSSKSRCCFLLKKKNAPAAKPPKTPRPTMTPTTMPTVLVPFPEPEVDVELWLADMLAAEVVDEDADGFQFGIALSDKPVL
jgi:hypothetical protein